MTKFLVEFFLYLVLLENVIEYKNLTFLYQQNNG